MIKAKDLTKRKEVIANGIVSNQLDRIDQHLLRTSIEVYYTIIYLPNLELYILNRIVDYLIDNGYRDRTETIDGGEYILTISWGEIK